MPHIELLGLKTRFSLSSGEALIDEAVQICKGGGGVGRPYWVSSISKNKNKQKRIPASLQFGRTVNEPLIGPACSGAVCS